MADCKLDLLKTEFSPYKITLLIELIPLPGLEFDLPMEDAGKKLSSVANYARETFGVRTGPIGPSDPGSQGKTGGPVKGDRKQREMAKMLKASGARAIKVMENELKLAKIGKDPARIERAETQLANALAMKKKNEASTGNQP